MHLHVSCHFIDLVSLVNDTRLNTLTFNFFTVTETQILAYGSLILLQLPIHFFILILKGQNIGLILLLLIIYGLTLDSWFFIEIHFNTFVKFNKTVNTKTKTFLTKLNILIYTILFFFIKYLWIFSISEVVIAL